MNDGGSDAEDYNRKTDEDLSEIPDELENSERIGGRSAVSGTVETTDTSVKEMMNASLGEESLNENVERIDDQWGGSEAARLGSEIRCSVDYFTDLNEELSKLASQPELIEEYGLDGEVESLIGRERFDYENDMNVGVGTVGRRLSYSPEEEKSGEDAGEKLAEILDMVTSREGPGRLMTFTEVAESDGKVEQRDLYGKEGYLAQPTVSLLTDDWSGELVEKYDNGSVEVNETGDRLYDIIREVEKQI